MLLKGQDESDLMQSGEFLHGLTGDLLDSYFPDEKAPLMASIEAAFDVPLVDGRSIESIEKKILVDFIRGINANEPTSMALLDGITDYLRQEEQEAREEQAADETVDQVVAEIMARPPAGNGEEVREITGPNGERIVMRIISGIATEPDEDDPERHDTAGSDEDDSFRGDDTYTDIEHERLMREMSDAGRAVPGDADAAGRVDTEAEGDGPATDGPAAEGGPVA